MRYVRHKETRAIGTTANSAMGQVGQLWVHWDNQTVITVPCSELEFIDPTVQTEVISCSVMLISDEPKHRRIAQRMLTRWSATVTLEIKTEKVRHE